MSKNDDKLIKREARVKLLAVTLLLVFALIIILRVENMLVSTLLAIVITYSLKPIVSYLERKGMSRTTSIVIPFIGVGLLLALGSWALSPIISQQLATAKVELPKFIAGFKTLLDRIGYHISYYVGPVMRDSFSEKAANYLQTLLQGSLTDLPTIMGKIFTVSILAPFFAFFLLRDGRTIMKHILRLVPNNLFELFLNLFHQINQQMGGFIRARALEALIVGGVTWLGLSLIGFPYSVFLGVFAGVTNLIPYIGPIIGATPAFVLALVYQDSATTIILMGGVYLAAQLIDMLFIIPLVVAKIVNLHPVTVVVVIIIGSQLLGVLGMIISIPVTSAIKLTVSAVYNHVVGFRV